MTYDPLGYHPQVQAGVIGTPPFTEPVLPDEVEDPPVPVGGGYVPQCYENGIPGGNLPSVGWTVQNAHGDPAFPPYETVGTMPDYDGYGYGPYNTVVTNNNV